MPRYFIGTAGWTYKDWVPSFYPKHQSRSFDWLSFYSKSFNCVEVNSTYYAYLNPTIVEGWLNKIEETREFIFTIKLHQDFTHLRAFDLHKIKAVIFNLEILRKAERFGGLLIQFPYSFLFNDVNASYIRKLRDIFQNYNCFVEVRHSSWNKNEVYDFFRQLDLTLCTIDQPQIGDAIPFQPVVTNQRAYIRFHGRNVDAWKKSLSRFGKKQSYDEANERYKYLYSAGELIEIVQKIRIVEHKVKEVFIIMNNHPQGDAVKNAFDLGHLLEHKKPGNPV